MWDSATFKRFSSSLRLSLFWIKEATILSIVSGFGLALVSFGIFTMPFGRSCDYYFATFHYLCVSNFSNP